MSVGTGEIRVFRDPFSAAHQSHTWSGSLLPWLESQWPGGPPAKLVVRLNGDVLPVADYDHVVDAGDVLEVRMLPGGPGAGAFLAKALVGALVSAAVSAVANALFGARPAKPRGAGATPAAERVNSLGVPTNVARLGEPVPVQYGRVRRTPDLASEPYRWYENNEQYIGALLCLGHGTFTVHETYIGDTPVSQLASGVASTWQYGPADHGQSMGAIEAGTGLWEDIETSVEVADQALQVAASPAAGRDEVWILALIPLATGADTITQQVQDSGRFLELWAGDGVTVTEYRPDRSGSLSLGGLTVDSSASHNLDADLDTGDVTGTITVTSTGSVGSSSVTVGGVAYTSIQTYTATVGTVTPVSFQLTGASATPDTDARLYKIVRTAGGVNEVVQAAPGEIGPFPAVGPGRSARAVQVDIEWPGGLYALNDRSGGLVEASVWLSIKVYGIDDDGVLGSLLATHTETVTLAQNTPYRGTFGYVVSTPQRVAVGVLRTTAPSDRAQDQSQCFWTQLRGVRTLSTGAVYGETTLLAVKIKATEGIASSAANLISVDCTRHLGGVATSAPSAALQDAYTSTVYGGRRPAAELDADALADLVTAESGHNGFNAVFGARRSLWDAMSAIVRPLRYYPVPLGGLISLARDATQEVDSSVPFTAANMTGVVWTNDWDRGDTTDGFRVRYTDPTTGGPAYVFAPSSTADPEEVELEGCTSAPVAQDYADGLWRRQLYRREYLRFETELEGHIVPIGTRVSVDHPLVGASSWVVQQVRSVDEVRTEITAWAYDARQYP